MSILIDTGVWFGYLNKDDQHSEEAAAIITACMEGDHGRVLTSSDIVDETFTLMASRGSPQALAEQYANQLGWTTERTPVASIVPISAEVREESFGLFQRHYEDKGLSFTDCTSVVTMRRQGIDAIASFDDGFDGLVERVAG